jgi:putative transposase
MTKLTKKQKSLLDELLKDFDGDAEALLGKSCLMMQLKKHAVEAMLEGELADDLGYEPNDPAGNGSGNSRNGRSIKTVQSRVGEIALEVPRDRNGSFEPQVVKKAQRRIEGIDDVIVSLYASGLSTRGIQAQLMELYGADVSPTLISNVTNRVLEEVQAWQARALDSQYPIIFFDCLFVKSRQDGSVQSKAVYLALGINMDGEMNCLACGWPRRRAPSSGSVYSLS